MLRHRTSLPYFFLAVLLISGTVFSQRGGAEVSATKCWEFPAEDVVELATDGRDIFAAVAGGKVFAVSSNGEKLWQTDLGGDVMRGVRVDGDAIFVTTRGTGGERSNRLSLATGLPAAGAQLRDREGRSDHDAKATLGDVVIVGNDAGVVTSLSGSGPVWKFKTGGGISAVISVEDKFIVISRDNFVYALRARNGGLEWKRRTQGRIGHYAFGKGVLFVSSLDQHGATLIDLGTGRVAGQIVLGEHDQLLTDPVFIGEAFIVATETGLTGYSLSSCLAK